MRVLARRPIVAIVLVALGVRGLALWGAADVQPVLDEQTYALRAQALLEGRGYLGSYQSWVRHPAGRPAELPQYPGAWQPPGYATFMAGAMALGGVPAVRLAQVGLGALTVWLVYALGVAWFGARAGRVAAWITALYPTLIAFSHYLFSETLFTFLLLLALWLLTRSGKPPSVRASLLGGAVLGLAALTRGTLFWMLPVLAGFCIAAGRGRLRPALGRYALVLAAALLVIAPWTLRNTIVHDAFVLIETNGPYNLWRGNGSDAFAYRNAPETPHYAWPFDGIPLFPVSNRTARRLVDEARAELGIERPSDIEIVAYANAAALRSIRSDPLAFIGRIRYRLTDMWNPTSYLLRHLQMGAYGSVSPGMETAVTTATVAAYLLVMGLAVAGLWLRRRDPRTWLVLLLVAGFSGVSALAFGLTRFRLPLMPLLILFAALPVSAWLARREGAARAATLVLATAPLLLLGCDSTRDGGGEGDAEPMRTGPNILWVVWDTARADHMSLYGHSRPTTPRLDAWSQNARVYEDAVSTAGYTLPSHASMFTGLLPTEHCTHNGNKRLDDAYTTIAELLRDAGWQTFLYSANPNVSGDPTRNFDQGFDLAAHPWSDAYREDALALVESKLPPEDRSSELRARLAAAREGKANLTPWNIKSAGEIAQRATLEWLESIDRGRPWFVFLNYMEAHRPYIPSREHRSQMMTDADVTKSYAVDRSWSKMWEYTFGLIDYSDEEIRLTRATYDASLRELDDLFAELIEALEGGGYLEDTIVALTSDHGEHLGERHMLDHQYSIYQPVLRVPLILSYPGHLEPGRDTAPAMNFDLFPTLLELVGIEAPAAGAGHAMSLLRDRSGRLRYAEDPSASDAGIRLVRRLHPSFDPRPYQQQQRTLIDDSHKFIWGSGGRRELFDLSADPLESRDLSLGRPELAARLDAAVSAFHAELVGCSSGSSTPERAVGATHEQRALLEALGYVEDEADEPPGESP